MAIANLRNATVQRVFFNGKGVALYESYESRGERRKSYYTAWFETAPNVSEGDVLANVSGLLQVKEREYEKDGQTRRTIDVSLNSAHIGSDNSPVQAATEWATVAPDDELPF